ncbi:MAG: tyrosine-protein phosphatase [Erysipelotrichales bacterium]|nr:tyrosine-protein phosphatase [Erysipelotrichales bacterium]
MARERIELENLINTRDLGGYTNVDGKKIKPKKLIRSAALSKGSENDLKVLCDEYNLDAIVDFRNSDELYRAPDPVMDGVTHIWCPIFEEKVENITREELWDTSDPLAMYVYFGNTFEQFQKEGGENETPDFYAQFVLNEHSIEYYKKFFDVLLEEREGSVLWHCSAGKDRCGMGTVYILKALGMSDELIYDDYLATNEYYEPENLQMIALADERGMPESFHTIIRVVNGVQKAFLDTVYQICEEKYGGLDNFLREKLELDDSKIKKLKDLYLE